MSSSRALLPLVFLACAARSVPPSPRSFVHNEGVVSEQAAGELSRILRAHQEKTGRQFVVALFQSLESESLEDYSHRVAQTWKIGGAKNDDGLLFCLFLKERRWRVEVGYGLEGALTDLEAAEIARDIGVPYFKAGDYDRGVLAVVRALRAKLDGGSAAAEDAPDIAIWIWLVILIFFYLLYRAGGNRRRSSYSRGRWDSGSDWSSPSSFGGGDSGGFSGGGGSFGGGGASGSW